MAAGRRQARNRKETSRVPLLIFFSMPSPAEVHPCHRDDAVLLLSLSEHRQKSKRIRVPAAFSVIPPQRAHKPPQFIVLVGTSVEQIGISESNSPNQS